MEILYGIILGLVQGATEFLPVSSSGHLALAEYFFNIREAGLTFDVFLHLGTLVGLAAFFRSDIAMMFRALSSPGQRRGDGIDGRKLLFFLVVATIPGAVAGLLLGDLVETRFRDPASVASTLALVGVVLLAAERVGRKRVALAGMGWFQALAIGAAQALAIFPGVSRSGATMSCALFLGLSREAAARFSFLLSGPIILGAGLVKLPEAVHAAGNGSLGLYAGGFFAAMISGYLFVAFMMRFVRSHSLDVFAWYRIALAGVVYAVLFWQS